MPGRGGFSADFIGHHGALGPGPSRNRRTAGADGRGLPVRSGGGHGRRTHGKRSAGAGASAAGHSASDGQRGRPDPPDAECRPGSAVFRRVGAGKEECDGRGYDGDKAAGPIQPGFNPEGGGWGLHAGDRPGKPGGADGADFVPEDQEQHRPGGKARGGENGPGGKAGPGDRPGRGAGCPQGQAGGGHVYVLPGGGHEIPGRI